MADPGTLFTDRRQAEIEKRLRAIYSEAQKDMEKRLNEHLDFFKTAGAVMKEKVDNGQLSLAKYQKWEKEQVFIGKTWKDKINSVTAAIHNANVTASNIINGERRAVFGENATYQAYKLEHDAGMDLSFTVYDSGAVTRLLRDQPELLKRRKIDGREDKAWNRTLISDIIAKNIIVGSSIPKIAQEIAEKTTARNKSASVSYARTAMTAAQNAGRIAALHDAQDMGIKVKKVWKATLDSRTRDSHADIDGEVKEIDEKFSNGLLYPGDPDGQASEVWNCRCTLIYKYDDYPMQNAKRYDQQNHELIENMTYKEWKAYKQSSPVTSVINHVIAQGKDITATWARRADKFAFEIEDVMNAQGFDGLPRLVDPDEFDRMVKEANGGQGFIAQRSYSAPDQETLDAYRDQLYRGDWYVDCGTGGAQYGQGMYCAADYTGTLTDGIKNEMEHYRDLGESRYGDAQRKYAEKVYQEEMDKVYFPLDDKYKNAFTDEMGITDMWTRGSEERQFIKEWISKNPAEANKLKEAYEKAQEIGVRKGMEIESLTREQFKEKYPNIGARSYTETLTIAPDAKVVTWREINDIRTGTLSIEYRNEVLEKELKRRGLAGDELTFARYNAGLGVSWNEVDAAARRLGAEKRNAVMEQLEDAGKVTQKLFDEEQARRKEHAHMYQEKYHDIGSLAAALGYDAINAENHGQSGSYTVILNRTKCIIRRPTK